mmetsp:Transcript_6298/g.18641  ORF Transcript_6298/g.18641 Transcript_6298/m.18641 type:complete len:219 (+) Transcript_6298:553-1209(+)
MSSSHRDPVVPRYSYASRPSKPMQAQPAARRAAPRGEAAASRTWYEAQASSRQAEKRTRTTKQPVAPARGSSRPSLSTRPQSAVVTSATGTSARGESLTYAVMATTRPSRASIATTTVALEASSSSSVPWWICGIMSHTISFTIPAAPVPVALAASSCPCAPPSALASRRAAAAAAAARCASREERLVAPPPPKHSTSCTGKTAPTSSESSTVPMPAE